MSETLTIRLRPEERAQWQRAAAAVKETVAEYVRNAVRQRGQSSARGQTFWICQGSGSGTDECQYPPGFCATACTQGMIYLLDTAPIASALAREEAQFGHWAKEVLRSLPTPLYTCEPVLTEAAHFLGSGDSVLAAVADGLLVCPWDLRSSRACPRIDSQIRRSTNGPSGRVYSRDE